ncbi:KTSC domain-containing protein [Streptomyces sp. NPDC001781]
MERKIVRSSNIVSIGYDAASMTLEVEFNSGVYRYHAVPHGAYRKLMAASSHGRYLATFIKGRYSYSKVS